MRNDESVTDAFEGAVYGSYAWHPAKDKNYWEVPPEHCWVKNLTGELVNCRDSDDFHDKVLSFFGVDMK